MKNLFIILLVLFFHNEVTAQNYSDSLTLQLKSHFEKSNLPGFSVAIVNSNGVLYQKGFGYANKRTKANFQPTTIHNLGSVSKTIVGLALVKVIEEGKLMMDTKINDILPFKIINPYFKNTPILVRHLATHTSSIRDNKHYGKTYTLIEDYDNEKDIHEDFMNFLKSHKKMTLKDFLYHNLATKGNWYKKKNYLKAKPGTVMEYSNLNAALMAYIIQIITKTPFDEYTKENIFIPLKMYDTSWSFKELDQSKLATPYFPMGKVVPRYKLITYPDGGLFSNVEDLSKLLQEIILAYQGKSEFLPPKYAALLLPGDEDNNRAFWGMGKISRNIGHRGSDPGAQADLQFNADSKIGRIILCNVNAEDNEEIWEQYQQIHQILANYEEVGTVKK